MPTTPPDGFLTRPDASRKFNRSQRALERDLDQAIATGDAEVLPHWRLVTKDGAVRSAVDVETDTAKELVAEGMAPTWYVAESWLEVEYGRKGQPKPRKQTPIAESPSQSVVETTETSSSNSALKREVEFLHDRVRTLERERREEASRNAAREQKLFEQLEVKDKQISAWDEITQGIVKGLATGQMSLAEGPSKAGESVDTKNVVHTDAVTATVTNEPKANPKPKSNSSKTKPKSKTVKRKASAKKPESTIKKFAASFFRQAS